MTIKNAIRAHISDFGGSCFEDAEIILAEFDDAYSAECCACALRSRIWAVAIEIETYEVWLAVFCPP